MAVLHFVSSTIGQQTKHFYVKWTENTKHKNL